MKMIINQINNNIPSTIGIYIFRDIYGKPLYIGKSVNIRARVKSHFENAKLDAKERAIVTQSSKIETIPTESEFKALLLESQLIQKHRPKYNKIWMDDKSYLYVKITVGEEYPKLLLIRKSDINKSMSFRRKPESRILLSKIPDQQLQNNMVVRNDKKGKKRDLFFGPFSSRRTLENLLREIRRVIPFCTAKRTTKTPCFYSKIGLCNPCPNYINQIIVKNTNIRGYLLEIRENPSASYIDRLKKQYRKNIKQIVDVFEGKTDIVLKNLRHELDTLSEKGRYEDAILIRDRILHFENLISNRRFDDGSLAMEQLNNGTISQSIDKLRDMLKVYFVNVGTLKRIECYDVSNLGGKQATAAMTVAIDGQIDKSQYRKFKIKNIYVETQHAASHEKEFLSTSGYKHLAHVLCQSKTLHATSLQIHNNVDWELMRGIFERRFKHQEWQFPNLIIVDGGKPQVRMAITAMQELKLPIPIVGIAKNPDRLVIGMSIDNMPTKRPEINNPGFCLIRLLRDEAHRFGRKYHLLLRKKDFLI